MFPSFISPPSVGYQRVSFSERGSLDRAGCDGQGAEFDDSCPEDSPIRAAERVILTDEDSKRICRKTDRVILSILVWVYFLQILDKTVLAYSTIFGLQEDLNLRDNQYSVLGCVAPIAQLAWQPFSFMLIVKVPHRILMPALVLGWGIAQALTPACHSFAELLINRFFLGLFEAGCLPLFSIITSHWYRRSEQPMRVAAWYGTNGLATIAASMLSYTIGGVKSPYLASWQIIFLSTGLLTVASVPFIYWNLDSDIQSARFLTKTEQAQAFERLRANQSGATSRELQWNQVVEVFLDVKTYLFIGMSLGNNLGAQVTNIFGPLILSGFGFDEYQTSLLNIPFGALQCAVILAVAHTTTRVRWKSLALTIILLPILIGLVLLYVLPRTENRHTPALLVGYYFFAFIFGCNTLIVSWILANTAGQTKTSVMMSLYNVAASTGNIVGPLLFDVTDAPAYHTGLSSTLAVYSMMILLVLVQAGNLALLNRAHARTRVMKGKPARIHDHSMEGRYTAMGADNGALIGNQAFADLTDRENDEFVYVY